MTLFVYILRGIPLILETMIRWTGATLFLILALGAFHAATVEAQSLCQPPTVSLSRGSTDAMTGGQVTRLQRFLVQHESGSSVFINGTFDAITESAVKRFQAKYGVSNSGTAATTGYGAVGPITRAVMQRTCSTSAPSVGVTAGVDQTPEIQIETVSSDKITGRYRNLAADSQIVLTNFYGGERIGGSGSTLVRSGGSGSFSFKMRDWQENTSLFYVQASPYSNPSQIIARSQQFQDATSSQKSPTCNLMSSSYRVQSGEKFKLSWTSKGAKYAWWEGEERSANGSMTLTETEPGVHQYLITAQGDPGQALCFAYVTVTGMQRTSSAPASPSTQTKPSGSFGNSSLTAYAENPVISGTARGVATVGFSIGKGDKIYGSGDIPVTNGIWTHRVATSLANGEYDIALSYYDAVQRKSVRLDSETLKVRAYSEAREVAGSPAIVSVYGSSAADDTVTVVLEGNSNTLPQALVLAAYRPVKWIIENPNDFPVTNVVVVGPGKQEVVSAPANLQVRYFTEKSKSMYRTSSDLNDPSRDVILKWIKRAFGYNNSGVFNGSYMTDYVTVYMGIKG